MLIIRRRPALGPARRIVFGGLNFSADSPCPGEAMVTLRRDSNVSEEWLVNAIRDVFSGIENTISVSYDRSGPYEFNSFAHVDYQGVLESQTGTSILNDARANVEFRTNMQADWGAVGETLSIQIINASTPTFEDIISTRVDVTGPAEFLHTGMFDISARQENVGLNVSLSDSFGYVESLQVSRADRDTGQLESTARQVADRLAQAESSGTTSTIFDTLGRLELSVIARRDSVGTAEQSTSARSDAASPSEVIITSRVTFDKLTPFENLAVWSREGLVPDEALRGVTSLAAAVLEVLLAAQQDGIAPIAIVGSAGVAADAPGAIEFLGGLRAERSAEFEALGAVSTRNPSRTLEFLAGVVRDAASPSETIASLLSDFPGRIESLSLTTFSADSLGKIENAGQSTAFPSLLLGIMEIGGGIGADTPAPAEAAAIIVFPFDPGARMPIEASWLSLDKTRTSIATGRVRLITAPYTAHDTWAQPFDPLAADTIDTFGLDFTADAGQATIATTQWFASFDSGSSGAVDDSPQARIITSWSPTTIYLVNPLDDTLVTVNGVFSTAVIGTFPASAVGGVYNLEAQVIFTDTRSIIVRSRLLCVSAES